jgi:hypothetical protein
MGLISGLLRVCSILVNAFGEARGRRTGVLAKEDKMKRCCSPGGVRFPAIIAIITVSYDDYKN